MYQLSNTDILFRCRLPQPYSVTCMLLLVCAPPLTAAWLRSTSYCSGPTPASSTPSPGSYLPAGTMPSPMPTLLLRRSDTSLSLSRWGSPAHTHSLTAQRIAHVCSSSCSDSSTRDLCVTVLPSIVQLCGPMFSSVGNDCRASKARELTNQVSFDRRNHCCCSKSF